MNNLPPHASSKLGTLLDSAMEAQAAINTTVDRIGKLEEVLFIAPNSERADEFKAELSRLMAKRRTQDNHHRALAATVTAIRAWLAKHSEFAFERVDPPTLALNPR